MIHFNVGYNKSQKNNKFINRGVQILSDIWKARGRDSSVAIATRYGLEGPGIEFRWERDFPRPSRPAVGPIQPPIKWVPSLSRG